MNRRKMMQQDAGTRPGRAVFSRGFGIVLDAVERTTPGTGHGERDKVGGKARGDIAKPEGLPAKQKKAARNTGGFCCGAIYAIRRKLVAIVVVSAAIIIEAGA
jgi:hypothetical protein